MEEDPRSLSLIRVRRTPSVSFALGPVGSRTTSCKICGEWNLWVILVDFLNHHF